MYRGRDLIWAWISATVFLGIAVSGVLGESLPEIANNNNHSPAGALRDGVLTIQLEIAKGKWHPEADDGMSVSVYAFGETGHTLQNPGPVIRVPLGTEIRASLHNQLTVPITVYGFNGTDNDRGVPVSPGATEGIRFKPSHTGLFFYWGVAAEGDLKLRHGIDSELNGALVVDPPGQHADDEIFVIEMMSDRPGGSARQTLATINGKSWPYTQRFQYKVGQTARWRWINVTNEPHSLHLHGFYFNVDAINRAGQVTSYKGDERPLVVTQRIAQGETFDMSWSPSRGGQWLFHCHMFQHMIPAVVPRLPGIEVTDSPNPDHLHADHTANGMGQLMLGVTVDGAENSEAPSMWRANRKLRLEISERVGPPKYAVTLTEGQQDEAASKAGLIGPPIVLQRGEPVEIEVVNRLKEPTAIHWHGIEVESFYDGVPGWSGAGKQISPAIDPGASFVARITPPRAGTFIYHTHWHDLSQLTNGIYGPLIVLPPGQKYDPGSDLNFVFSIGDFGGVPNLALINGTPQAKTLQLQAGKKYRFRFINISTNNQGLQVSLRNPNGPVDWLNIAKDGIDLKPVVSKAQRTITVGETFDVEFTSSTQQDLLLDLLLPAQKIHTTQTLAFTTSPSTQ